MQEPESLADLSVWLSVRERPVDARNGPDRGKLVGRCIVVGLVFVVVLNFRLLPLSSPVVDASLSDEKEKCIVDRGIVETLTYPFIVVFLSFFCFVENVETPYNNRSGSKAAFHDSTNPQQQSVNVSSPSL